MDRILMVGTLDNLKIQPIDGIPFLLAHSIILFIKMVLLKRYVRASGYEFVKLQSMIRKYYNEFDSYPELMERFRCICSNIFTYVGIWDDEIITSQMYRLFSKNTQEEKL